MDTMGTKGSKTRYGLDRKSVERDSRIQFLRASGPGGQHRNKVETGVRVTHGPTGISVTATDMKSQSKKRENALGRLHKKLIDMNTPKVPRTATKVSRRVKAQRIEQKRKQSKKKDLRRDVSQE